MWNVAKLENLEDIIDAEWSETEKLEIRTLRFIVEFLKCTMRPKTGSLDSGPLDPLVEAIVSSTIIIILFIFQWWMQDYYIYLQNDGTQSCKHESLVWIWNYRQFDNLRILQTFVWHDILHCVIMTSLVHVH